MAIRSAAKAVIVHEGKVLLNRCVSRRSGVYFDLPGGGQNQYESMEEAVIREVLEETGYRIRVDGLLALAEEIYDDAQVRNRHPDYAHRILHIFSARLADARRRECTEKDGQQEESVWVRVDEADTLAFRPALLSGKISSLIAGNHPQYLGCVHVK